MSEWAKLLNSIWKRISTILLFLTLGVALGAIYNISAGMISRVLHNHVDNLNLKLSLFVVSSALATEAARLGLTVFGNFASRMRVNSYKMSAAFAFGVGFTIGPALMNMAELSQTDIPLYFMEMLPFGTLNAFLTLLMLLSISEGKVVSKGNVVFKGKVVFPILARSVLWNVAFGGAALVGSIATQQGVLKIDEGIFSLALAGVFLALFLWTAVKKRKFA